MGPPTALFPLLETSPFAADVGRMAAHPILSSKSFHATILAFLLGFVALRSPASSSAVSGASTSKPSFRVATFNVENYLVRPAPGRKPKPEASRDQVARLLSEARPDVVALQEIGDPEALADLQRRLATLGMNLPHAEIVRGHDTNICVAVLSRFPFLHRRPHTNESFLLDERRIKASRGFAEVSFSPAPGHRVVLVAAHLKSKRAVGLAAEAEMREQEAILLREKADAILAAERDANLVVCGDFNDTPDSRALRALIGRGNMALIDTRPAEPGLTRDASLPAKRTITWTHHFAREDAYARIDYILVSRGLAREWRREETYIQATPDWGLASDHRLLVATFDATDR